MASVRLNTTHQLEHIAEQLRQIADAQTVQARAMVTIAEAASRHERLSSSQLYSRKEAARLLQFSTRTVDRLIARGTLIAVRQDRRVMVAGDSLEKLRTPERHRAVEVRKL